MIDKCCTARADQAERIVAQLVDARDYARGCRAPDARIGRVHPDRGRRDTLDRVGHQRDAVWLGSAVDLVDTLGECFSGRVSGRLVDHLVLDRGELAEAALAAPAVVGLFDPGHDRQAQVLAGGPALVVQDVLLQQGEVGLHSGVVARCTDPAHGPDQAVGAQSADELP